jgi:acyl-CoA dehydrogenase
MITLLWILGFIFYISLLAYRRASLQVFTIAIAAYLILIFGFSQLGIFMQSLLWLIFLVVVLLHNATFLRRQLITRPIFTLYKKLKPSLSDTEKEALSIGTVDWEGELFSGMPDWKKLEDFPVPQLTDEEQTFLDNEVNELCSMINNWSISRNFKLPDEMLEFIKKKGFFGLIIPKEYGGKGFSALAHSAILCKIAGKSSAVASVVSVPNSLGPAELLLEYGTDQQKQHYLPRLAKGEEIPCFALTSPDAGSDAGSMPDYGIVCKGQWQGQEVLGIRLEFNKRYITLAPIATIVGLAFKLYDPDHLIGHKESLGITCALIPADVQGMAIGRRHFPLHCAFPNGPVQGKDVFIPLDAIIGGVARAGQGWYMLMERLSIGRAVSLPSVAVGGSKAVTFMTSAYARIRKQFSLPIGKFEGVALKLAEMACQTYMMDALRLFGVSAIDRGEQPTIPSAISKYHATELAREVSNAAMDINGGKGICMGPRNYVAQGYIELPIAVTVEGANILTRNMIIFGQGVMRCHPYLLKELEAAQNEDSAQGLKDFDHVFFAHIGYLISNKVRASFLAITSARFAIVPAKGKYKRYYQHLTRFSAAFALLADMTLIVLGGEFKRKESLSARLGDILSLLYIGSAVLKHYENQGSHAEDLPIVDWTCQKILSDLQTAFDGVLTNFPNYFLELSLRMVIFPLGRRFKAPDDTLVHKVSDILLTASDTRYRLAEGVYLQLDGDNMPAVIDEALQIVIKADAAEKKLDVAIREGKVTANTFEEMVEQAFAKQVLDKEEVSLVNAAKQARDKIIAVDDFAAEEIERDG